MARCNCDQSIPIPEEYHIPLTDSETLGPSQEWRTSTRYYDEPEDLPEYVSSTPQRRRIPRRDFRHTVPRDTRGIPRRADLIVGVAIVPRRIDFDAVSDIEDLDEESLARTPAETLQRLREAAQQPIPEFIGIPKTYKLKRFRHGKHPPLSKRQYAPRIVRMTPCGKCLRI